MNHKVLIQQASGQNRNNRALFVCYYSFEIGQLQSLTTKSVRHFSNCSSKLIKVPDHLMCNLKRSGAFTGKPEFVNLTVLSIEFT